MLKPRRLTIYGIDPNWEFGCRALREDADARELRVTGESSLDGNRVLSLQVRKRSQEKTDRGS